MEILLDGGLRAIQMGIQSASQRVLDDVYNRKISVAKTRDVIRQIEPYQKTHRLLLFLDFIIDNPYCFGGTGSNTGYTADTFFFNKANGMTLILHNRFLSPTRKIIIS